MQRISKKEGFILIGTIITFLITNVLCVLFEFIQTWLILEIEFHLIILLFLLNVFFVVYEYFFVKRLIERYSKWEYSDLEQALIKLDIILTQSAGIIMAFPLASCVNRRYFSGMYGGIGVFCVVTGMCMPLAVMLLAVVIKDICPEIKMILRKKKEKQGKTENRGMTVILLVLTVFMCAFTFAGSLLGKEMMRIPDFSEVLEKKTNIIKKNKDYIEKIREYVENLNFEELTAYGGQEEKDEDFDVIYREEKDYGSLILNTQKIMDEIGLKNKNVIEPEGKIVVEFDTKTYKIRKISISIEYRRLGYDVDVPVPSRLAWYSPDYTNRSFSWVVLDENWQIESPQS